jgi:outer membrane protein insertion porin family
VEATELRATLAVVALALLTGASGAAQSGPLALRPGAQLASVEFRFHPTQSFRVADLEKHLRLEGRASFYRTRRLLGKLPLIDSPSSQRFDPIELQKDVSRLRRFYQESGFPRPEIDYEVESNDAGTEARVTFLVEEGPAVVLRELQVSAPTGLPDSLTSAWGALARELASLENRRFGITEGRTIESKIVSFLGDQGYLEPTVRSTVTIDSTEWQANVVVQVETGPRRRVGPILVDGNKSVTDRVVERELPFATGDWLSATDLARGRARVQQVSLFRQVTLTPGAAIGDSLVPLRISVGESRPRLSLAEVGYVSDGPGLTGRVQWTHPNFTGGARSLTASLEVQTGVASLNAQSERLLHAGLTLTQPYVFVPGLIGSVGPFFEFQDDYRDQSVSLGAAATLVYRLTDLSSVVLQYRYRAREILEYRFGDVAPADLSSQARGTLEDIALLDSLGSSDDESTVSLSASLGRVDNVVNPRRGILFRPSVAVTFPAAISTASFVRLDLTTSGYYPLGREVVAAGRLSWGRLLPYGKSVPGPGEDPTIEFVYLRDQSMTAGGTDDVRGWENRMLGPKVPDVETTIRGTDTVLVADHYSPIGALARLTGSLELRFPAPGLSSNWGSHIFLDGGRVWTPDERFSQSPFLPAETDFRFAAGTGLSYLTPVGAIRVSLAYKLNPSDLDLRDPGEVLAAAVAGAPLGSVPTSWWRRLHLHLSIGLAF